MDSGALVVRQNFSEFQDGPNPDPKYTRSIHSLQTHSAATSSMSDRHRETELSSESPTTVDPVLVLNTEDDPPQ